MKAQDFYFIEMTDLYQGEANFNWCDRFLIQAKSISGAIRKFKKDCFNQPAKAKHRLVYDGSYKFDNMAICFFVESIDQEQAEAIKGEYIHLKEL